MSLRGVIRKLDKTHSFYKRSCFLLTVLEQHDFNKSKCYFRTDFKNWNKILHGIIDWTDALLFPFRFCCCCHYSNMIRNKIVCIEQNACVLIHIRDFIFLSLSTYRRYVSSHIKRGKLKCWVGLADTFSVPLYENEAPQCVTVLYKS